jgi:phosphonate transport system substrate-binding protein
MRLALAALLLLLGLVPAGADWRDDIKVLRLGVVAGGNAPYRLAQLEPFRLYLQEKLGLPVEIVLERSYAALIEAQESARIPYAIHTASSYAVAAATCACVQPLAAPRDADGAPGYHAVLLARSDSAIRSLADARGKRLALASPDSVAGYLVPMKAFEKEAIGRDQFSAVAELPDQRSAVSALITGNADVAVAWSSLDGDFTSGYSRGLLTDMVAASELSMDEVRIIWQSALIPYAPHVVRNDMPPELRDLLKAALLSVSEENPVAYDGVDRIAGGGLAETGPDIYAPLAELAAAPPGSEP